jgi:hypothetical protein
MTRDTVPVSKIPEVASFTKIREELESFKRNNPEFFEELGSLVERYNAALDAADKAVRAKQISCGDFRLMSKPTVYYDAEKLYEELGDELFVAFGGAIRQVTEYTVEKSVLESHIARGAIPQNIIKDIKSTRCRYDKPEKVVLP